MMRTTQAGLVTASTFLVIGAIAQGGTEAKQTQQQDSLEGVQHQDNAEVIQRWIRRYDDPGHGSDTPSAIAVDATGNSYVTGDSAGMGGWPNNDWATVKYAPNGQRLWVARFNDSANYVDDAEAIVVDEAGNVYVTGSGYSTQNFSDYVTIKYDADGNQLWLARYDSLIHGIDHATAVTVDATGNVYVTGRSGSTYGGSEYGTIKYNPNGNQLWIAFYEGVEGQPYLDSPVAIAVDASGNVYVAGTSNMTATESDYATIKHDANGTELWVARYNGPSNGDDEPSDLAIDELGNVYVTGQSEGGGTSADYATIKYDANGNELWVARYDGPISNHDGATALELDSQGNIFVTGHSNYDTAKADYATIKYDPDGNQLWVARYHGGYSSHPVDLALDIREDVYVTGMISGSPGTIWDTVKYNSNGIEQWIAHFVYSGSIRLDATDTALDGLAVDEAGNVYVAGSLYLESLFDYITIKYSQRP